MSNNLVRRDQTSGVKRTSLIFELDFIIIQNKNHNNNLLKSTRLLLEFNNSFVTLNFEWNIISVNSLPQFCSCEISLIWSGWGG